MIAYLGLNCRMYTYPKGPSCRIFVSVNLVMVVYAYIIIIMQHIKMPKALIYSRMFRVPLFIIQPFHFMLKVHIWLSADL